ncbi:hypothetical protein [Streptomyces lomondensis]|uniref:WXG100 family type VII secretion target n=1 Tax=Streptomyces lomondensis TaxID=68229 RepID=A0ABQ2WW11_9ACTN|nr:hypothetical protein [Streptomyces lomondensis]MCF0079133.1 hypothetical protein [Streptomyces lomondensis]GGW82860.1 hypothetical protein GCM10010383_09030 [Streptomyces lomondensis]
MIKPESIPLFTGDLAQLEQHTDALRDEADGIRQAGAEAHRQFQGLSAFYQAPEAEDLFASTKPVRDAADSFGDKVATVADALRTYAAEVAPIAKRLEQLQSQAATFVAGLKTSSGEFDENWTDDADKVSEHQALMHDVAVAQAAFTAAEIACNNKITALVGGTQYVMNTGAKQFTPRGAELYGYSAEVLDQAKELPWGTPVTQSHDWWDPDDLGYYAKSFFWDGIIVDNVWGTIDGLATLAGFHGSDSAGQAWEGLVRAVVGAETYLMESGGRKPTGIFASDFAQDSKEYAKEFAKGFVAWDMWEENPSRAAATVVFNGLTLGVGPLKAASAGKAGAAAKTAATVAKVGEIIDPLGAAVKVTGHAVPTIARVTHNLRGVNDIPDLRAPHSVLELDDGSKVVIENGEFIAYDKQGNVVSNAPTQERSATSQATPEQTPAGERQLVGAGSRGPSPQASASGGGRPASGSGNGSGVGGDATRGSGTETSHLSGGSGNLGEAGDGGRLGNEAARSDGHGTDGRDNTGDQELTPEERKRRQDELVRKANDPDWRKLYYDARGHRLSTKTKVNGVELPIITQLPNGEWIAKYDMPSGPSETKFGSKPLGPDTVPEGNLPELDAAAKNRKVALDLTNAEKAYKETPTPAAHEALAKAQKAYADQLGDVPNNSKIPEALGEKSADLHVVPHEFPHAKEIKLPKTPTGADMFDKVYELGDGQYLIVEAKAPSGDLDWRRGVADPEDPANPRVGDDGGAQGMRVKQGTRLYVRSILGLMTRRGGRDAEIAADLRQALKTGKLQYALVKARKPDGSSYAGAMFDYFKI